MTVNRYAVTGDLEINGKQKGDTVELDDEAYDIDALIGAGHIMPNLGKGPAPKAKDPEAGANA